MKELYDLKEMLCKELKQYGSEGEMNASTLDVVDKLTHSIKNLDKVIEVYEEEEGYSEYAPMDGGYYRRQRRDSRGRYARYPGYNGYPGAPGIPRYPNRNYSRNDLVDKIRQLMDNAPDDRTRQEIQRMVEQMENN